MTDLAHFKAAYVEISNFIINSLNAISMEEVESLVRMLTEAYRGEHKVLLVGVGRSGLVARAFAMRLMHLGFRSFVLGETITPSIGEGDLLIAISGSGTTSLVVAAAEAAKMMKSRVVAVTSFRDSPLAKLSDLVVNVPGRTKVARMDDYFARQVLGIHEPLAPLGTLFEDTVMVLLDSVIAELMYRLGKTENDLKRMHANVEFP
jgi:6-phospho-3-hexuloisomerase